MANAQRILFYGGCHAGVLAKLFREFAQDDGNVFDSLINYELIGARKPFPYERVATYDAVVFSPIHNRVGYETSEMRMWCEERGIKTLCYPWLQWNGYYPFASKGAFFTEQSWFYGKLPNFGSHQDYQSFQAGLKAAFCDTASLEANLAETTAWLKNHEEISAVDIPVSNFILENYKERRLFLTPDHPAKTLYDYVVRRISEALDLKVRDSYYWSAEEPQDGIQVPILPWVSDRLNVKFHDADHQHFMGDLGRRKVHFEEYMRILYGVSKRAKVFKSKVATQLKARAVFSADLAKNEKVLLPPDVLVQGVILSKTASHIGLNFNWIVSSTGKPITVPFQTGFLFADHWLTR